MARFETNYVADTEAVNRARFHRPYTIDVDVGMGTDSVPVAPTYAETISQLDNNVDKADFVFAVAFAIGVDGADRSRSYVTSVSFRFTRREFVFRIAAEFAPRSQNWNDNGWVRKYRDLLDTHGQEHFHRYRRTIDSVRRRMEADYQRLPSSRYPANVRASVLQGWVDSLARYWNQMFAFELQADACDWDYLDYPALDLKMRTGRHRKYVETRVHPSCRHLQPPSRPSPSFTFRVPEPSEY